MAGAEPQLPSSAAPAPGRAVPRRDGRRDRWDAHKAERREQVLAAAVAVVEETEPGAEVPVSAIAARAGLSRTVLYRHFADRADLDAAVQAYIVQRLFDELLPAVTLEGSIGDIIERIVATYVAWSAAHPALHRMIESDLGGPAGPGVVTQGTDVVAGQVLALISAALELLGGQLSEDDVAVLDPLTYGLVGAVVSAVRRWLALPERRPDAVVLAETVTDSVWYLLDGHARALGVHLDRDQPLVEILEGPPLAGTDLPEPPEPPDQPVPDHDGEAPA
ncbi:TetR/AcrR family transcriptional regulator [Nocardioides sp. GY 10127]|uniref:TetR/AcrR family transcriptional regulator n=1 Tax=Nocardioides sp. GY 10127 TaxID=2569762 RepID=UPI0010A7BA5B|nr:TetR/AcrR family transcriptional regulator [Nocardioides sp. GY 10127]TIC85520.1 TetR/AcrR family transcriptional regulator [Nocardioides sp. GY 10127]